MDSTKAFNLYTVAQMVIDSGADANFQYSKHDNNTLLHLAVEDKNLKYVKLVLEQNLNLNIRNKAGETALELALRLNHDEIVKLLNNNKNNVFSTINKKFIYELEGNFSYQQVEKITKQSQIKILRIKNCKNVKALFDKIHKKAFRKAFSKLNHLFVFIIETHESHEVDLNLETSMFNDRRPLVIQVMDRSQKSTIYYTEFDSTNIVKIEDLSEISVNEFSERFASQNCCNLPTLIQSLNSNILGNLSGDLTSAKLIKGELLHKALRSAAKYNALCLRFLKLFGFEVNLENSSLFETLKDVMNLSLMALLDLSFDVPEEKCDFEILMALIKSNNIESLKQLLMNDFNLDIETKHITTSLELGHFDCAAVLIEADSGFPAEFINSQILAEESNVKIKEVIDGRNSFHDAIKGGNIELVKGFISSSPRLKYAYDTSNKSALAVAVEAGKFEIYSLLRSRGFSAGIDKSFEAIMTQLNDKDKIRIRESNKEYFKAYENSHLFHILTKTKFSFSSENIEDLFKEIRLLYEQLNAIPEIQPILKLLENWETFQILFDRTKSHVMDMDPGSGYIYIAAENFIMNLRDIRGTFAHELAHLAMQLIYGNLCKPYEAINTEQESEFEEISQQLHKYCLEHPNDVNPIVSTVFNYPKDRWHAELIVRVPHLAAVFFDNKDELLEVKLGYCSKLFDFYMNKTMKDIENKIKLIKPQAEIQEINRTIGMLKRIQNYEFKINEAIISDYVQLTTVAKDCPLKIVNSNVPMLTLSLIYQLFRKTMYGDRLDREVIFADEESLRNQHLSKKISDLCKSAAKPHLIVKAETLDKINDFFKIQTLSGKVKLLIAFDNQDKHLELKHTWNDLDTKSQSELLQREIMFQEHPVKMEVLMPASCADINAFPLEHLISDQLKIENIKEIKSDSLLQGAYINRNFIVQRVEERQIKPSEAEESQRKGKLNRMISLDTTYDPRTVSVYLNLNELMDQAATNKIVIISDVAGMGKSTTLKEIAKFIKEKHPSHWVSIFDLKQHIDKFEKIQNSSTPKTLDEITLLCIDNHIDKNIFSSL